MEGGKRSTAYDVCFYMILIGVVSETLFLHYKSSIHDNELKRIIDDIKAAPIADRQIWMRRFGNRPIPRNMEEKLKLSEQFDKLIQLEPGVKSLKQHFELRIRRDVEANSLTLLRTVNILLEHVISLKKAEASLEDRCRNVTLVCRKGERGTRGNPGPRGLKGEIGRKGERGFVGPKGIRGPVGASGQKGQKGDPGPIGKSIEKPKFVTKFPNVVTKKESSNLSLVCEANGNPEPEIRWEFGTQKTDSRYTYPLKGAFSLTNINENDQGVIRCVAKNILGSNMIETKLNVHTKPKITLSAAKRKAIEGVPVEVECNATGNPVPKISWKRNIGEVNGEQYLSKDGLKLRFQHPIAADSGEYACEAVNSVGKAVKSMLLVVEPKKDCSEQKMLNSSSSVYMINPDGKQPFQVFCDMATDGGGWTVIQRRADGSVDFYKTWMEYKTGFGNLDNEFWLGNDKIHRLTKGRNMKIRFDLEDFKGNKAYAVYSMFYIDGEDEKYKVHVGSYEGNAGDSFSYHNGMKFSTKDRDNDKDNIRNCARNYNGAWWYNNCYYSNLNGRYFHNPNRSEYSAVVWFYFKRHISLKKTEIKVKPMK